MRVPLSATLEYDGEELNYSHEYFKRGVLNPKVRVYESDNYRLHLDEETGQLVVIGSENQKQRVKLASEPHAHGEPVSVVEAEH